MAATSKALSGMKECVACKREMFVNIDQPAICGECELCPKCGIQSYFRISVDSNIFECEWCEHQFESIADIEKEVHDYWVKKAKNILGLK